MKIFATVLLEGEEWEKEDGQEEEETEEGKKGSVFLKTQCLCPVGSDRLMPPAAGLDVPSLGAAA